jgi:phosphotransferase system  glucose/maltose/N-acetylglucosamine-specific IIC component
VSYFFLGCWILPQFQAEQILTVYLWVWLAALFMIILYGITFAIIHRWFNIAQSIRWNNQNAGDALDVDSDDDKKVKAVANSMLLLVYFFIIEG